MYVLYDARQSSNVRSIHVGDACAKFARDDNPLPMLFAHEYHRHFYCLCGFSNGNIEVFDVRTFRHVDGWKDGHLDVVGDIVHDEGSSSGRFAAFGIAGFTVFDMNEAGSKRNFIGSNGQTLSPGSAMACRQAYHASGSFIRDGRMGVMDPRGIVSFYDVSATHYSSENHSNALNGVVDASFELTDDLW